MIGAVTAFCGLLALTAPGTLPQLVGLSLLVTAGLLPHTRKIDEV